jgi:hypothetical protein
MRLVGFAVLALVLTLPAVHIRALGQVTDATLEACNAMKHPKRRLACLKDGIAVRPVLVQPAPIPAPTAVIAPLGVFEAVQICDALLENLQSRRDRASEFVSGSTPSELVVTWPAVGTVQATYCKVGRTTRKLVSFTIDGRTFDGPAIAALERRAEEKKQFNAGNYAAFVGHAKEALTAAFKDPSSAQFQRLFVSGATPPALCGEVNGKNSYGGYVGFRRFYATEDGTYTNIEDVKDNYVFATIWPKMCNDKVADIP